MNRVGSLMMPKSPAMNCSNQIYFMQYYTMSSTFFMHNIFVLPDVSFGEHLDCRPLLAITCASLAQRRRH